MKQDLINTLRQKLMNNDSIKELAWCHVKTREEVIDALSCRFVVTKNKARINFLDRDSGIVVRESTDEQLIDKNKQSWKHQRTTKN